MNKEISSIWLSRYRERYVTVTRALSDFNYCPLVESFENALTKLTSKICCFGSSGTSALHLACMALGIKGDWVIVPQ